MSRSQSAVRPYVLSGSEASLADFRLRAAELEPTVQALGLPEQPMRQRETGAADHRFNARADLRHRAEGRLRFVNAACADFLQKPQSELIGQRTEDARGPELHALHAAHLKRCCAAERSE